jgi:hypothetical protein
MPHETSVLLARRGLTRRSAASDRGVSLIFRRAKFERSKLIRLVAVLVGLIGLLASTSPIHAQEDKASPDPVVIKNQLLQFSLLTRKNLRDIQALPADDSIPVDPVVRDNARRAYILIRTARWGIDLAMQKATYQDPMLVLAHKRVEEAWNLCRYPVDFAQPNVPRAEYISKSVQDLSRSLKLVQQALAILP